MMTNLPAAIYRHFRDDESVLAGTLAFTSDRPVLRSGGLVQRVVIHRVSKSFFTVLGVRPVMGGASDGRQDAAVLSHRFWKSRFGGDPNVIGTKVEAGRDIYTIAGVMPQGFFGVDRERVPDLWLPLGAEPLRTELWVLARLKPGVTAPQARAALGGRFRAALEDSADAAGYLEKDRAALLAQRLLVQPASRGTSGMRWSYWEYSQTLKILMATMGMVLLICCANVANLLLARGTARRREIGIRLAVGAGRGRIVRQLLTEHLLVAGIAGAVGLLTAAASHRMLIVLLAGDLQTESIPFALNARVLAFAGLVSVVTGLLAGLLPAFRAADTRLLPALYGGTQHATARMRLAGAVLGVQVAVSIVLLTGAGLFARTLDKLTRTELGFDRNHLLVTTVEPPEGLADTERFWAQVADAAMRVPGVRSVTLAGNAALGGGTWSKRVWVRNRDGSESDLQLAFNSVGPGFFETVGMRLLAGREFSAQDNRTSPRVAVVNAAFARRMFGTTDVVGRRFGDGGPGSSGRVEIVGVVGDAKVRTARDEFRPVVYQPFLQPLRKGPLYLHVRVQAEARELNAALVRAVASVDARVFVDEIKTVDQVMHGLVRRDRTFAGIAAVFAAIAVLLACVGIYGVVAFRAGRRTAEIGIRIALGAGRRDVVWMVLRDTALVLAAGAAVGIPAAIAAAGALRGMLYGVEPADPLSVAGATAVLVGTGLTAGFLPARRAASIAPVEALRIDG
jgi:predicted permease